MLQELSSALSSLKEQLIEEFERRVASALDETKKALATALGDMVPRAIAQTHSTPLAPTTSIRRPSLTAHTTHEQDLSNTSKRRLIDRSPPSSNVIPALLSGTAAPPTSSHPILTVPPAPPRFWLYLTRIAPSVSESEVETFVKEQLGTDDVIIIKLTPKDRDTDTSSIKVFNNLTPASFL